MIESKQKKFLNSANLRSVLLIAIPVIALLLLPLIKANIMNFVLNILILVFIYMALGQSWNILAGFLGLLSMGHCVFFGLGSYLFVLTITRFNLNPLLGVLFGIIINVIVAFIIGIISIRVKDIFFAMVTLAVAQTLFTLSLQWVDVTRGPRGLLMPPDYMYSKQVLYYIAMGLAAFSVILVYLIRKSRMGTLFHAIRDDEDKAKSLGVNSVKWKVMGCIVSAVMASLVGSFYAIYIRAVQPTLFSFDITMKIMILVFIGGRGTVTGPIYGAFTVIIADELIRGWLGGKYSGLPGIVYGLILVLMILYKPGGLASIFSKKSLISRNEL